MPAKRGRDFLLEMREPNDADFVIVAGVRTKSLTLSARLIDASSADSADQWRELLAGAGAKSARASGAGVFTDAQSDAALRRAFFAQTATPMRLTIPDFGRIEAQFIIERLEYAGAHDAEASFEVDLASAGPLTFIET